MPNSTCASISACRQRAKPQISELKFGFEDALDGLRVFIRNAGETRLDASDAELGELAGDLELVVGREADAGRLLAVAQRRVVEADGLGAVEPLLNGIQFVERAGPNLVGPDVHGASPAVLPKARLCREIGRFAIGPSRGAGGADKPSQTGAIPVWRSRPACYQARPLEDFGTEPQ